MTYPIHSGTGHRGVHVPICAECRCEWPCEHAEVETQIKRLNWRLEHICPGCGDVAENGQHRRKADGRWYHTAKHRMACRRAFVAAGGRL